MPILQLNIQQAEGTKGSIQQWAGEYLGKLAFINLICKHCQSFQCMRLPKWTSVIRISNLTDPSHWLPFSRWMLLAVLLCLSSDSKLFSLTGIIVLLKPPLITVMVRYGWGTIRMVIEEMCVTTPAIINPHNFLFHFKLIGIKCLLH